MKKTLLMLILLKNLDKQWRNSMIEQLHLQSICDIDGNHYGHRAPSNFELMEKINELVDEVNRLKEKLGEE